MDTLDLLDRIAACTKVGEAWGLGSAYFRAQGFARQNYGLTRFLSNRSIGDPEDALFLTTSEPLYTELYLRNRFYETTPIYRWVLRNTGATTWRWVQEDYLAGRLPPDEADAVRLNARFGIVAGIAISFPETGNRTKGALGLTADRGIDHDGVDRIWAASRGPFMAVANMMHLKIASLPPPAMRRPLTVRQREALEWVSDGKTAADIALLMGVTAAMVEKHLRLARDALNVETTAQAVAKATLMNLIFARPEPTCDAVRRLVDGSSGGSSIGNTRNGGGKDSLTFAGRGNAAF